MRVAPEDRRILWAWAIAGIVVIVFVASVVYGWSSVPRVAGIILTAILAIGVLDFLGDVLKHPARFRRKVRDWWNRE